MDESTNSNNKNKESTTPTKFENHLLSIRDERQKMIHPNSHPTYNEHHEKIIEVIDWALKKYKETTTVTNIQNNQQTEEHEIIDNIIENLIKKKI